MSSLDQQFLEFIVKSLVSNPAAVKISRRIDEKGVLLELIVDPEDLGRVIGKRGATANSIRNLLRALGTKNDARYNLKIVDNGPGPNGGSYDRPRREESEDNTVLDAPAQEIEAETDEDLVEVDLKSAKSSSVVSKTRKELEELDDLDV